MNNFISRRNLLKSTSCGFGYMALAGLATEASANDVKKRIQNSIGANGNPLAPREPHFAPTAKRVIFLCMRGGPSHVDTFDYKPALKKDDGKPANGAKGRKLMKSPWKFNAHGESGLQISELFPNVAKHADDLCLLNGMYADVPSHPQAFVQLHTGNSQFVRPSVGAWVTYGLGTQNSDLPGYISISPPGRVGGAQNYGSSFLPAVYQGTPVGALGKPIKDASLKNLKNNRLSPQMQREQIDLVQSLNKDLRDRKPSNPELDGVIESYELAYRMQSAVPDVMDIDKETKQTLNSYGIGNGLADDFGRQCLLARRFAEAGVRYIELAHSNWDQHGNLKKSLTGNCKKTDQPIAALLADLKQRDMLKDTLVVWGGEFGRTPHVKKKDGRDHNATGFTFWMAGGGVKGGMKYGSTDEHGIKAVEDRVHFHDLHATMLHTLGLDHEKLTYKYSGRDFRLTDVYGNVLHDILA